MFTWPCRRWMCSGGWRFLDDQVTRIDDIIAARQEQVALGVAQHLAWLSDEYESLSAEWGAALCDIFSCRLARAGLPSVMTVHPARANGESCGLAPAMAAYSTRTTERRCGGLAPRLEYEVKTGDLLSTGPAGH